MTFTPDLPTAGTHPGRGTTGVRGGAGTVTALAAVLAEAEPDSEVAIASPANGTWTVADLSKKVTAVLSAHTPAGHLIVADADRMRPGASDRLLISAESPAGNWHLWLVGAPHWTVRNVIRSRMRALLQSSPSPDALAAAVDAGAADPEAVANLAGGTDPARIGAACLLCAPGPQPRGADLIAAAAAVAGAADWKSLTPAARPAAVAALTAAADQVSLLWARRAAHTSDPNLARTALRAADAWTHVGPDLDRNIAPAATLAAAGAALPGR